MFTSFIAGLNLAAGVNHLAMILPRKRGPVNVAKTLITECIL